MFPVTYLIYSRDLRLVRNIDWGTQWNPSRDWSTPESNDFSEGSGPMVTIDRCVKFTTT